MDIDKYHDPKQDGKRAPKKTRPFYLFLLCIPLLCLSWSCMSTGRPNLSKEQFMRQVYLDEIKPAVTAAGETGDVKIPFRQALELAVKQDETFALVYFSRQKDLLDLKQAKSMLFPRVHLQVFNETYQSSDDKKIKSNFDAGLSLQYNLLNLLLQRDAISMEKASAQKSLYQGRMEVQNIYSRLLKCLLEIAYNRKDMELKEQALKYAKAGLSISEQWAKEGRVQPGTAWKWSSDVQQAQEEYESAESRLALSLRSLKYMLGRANARDIEIPDAENFMPGTETFRSGEINTAEAITDAWNHRYEVKTAELDLFLAEMNVLKAKMNWLSFFRVNLGFGRFFIYRNDERANVTLNTALSLPLLDLGDSKRLKKKAVIDRDMARVRITNLARKLSREVRESVENTAMLKQRLANAESMKIKAQGQITVVERLMELGQEEPLDLYTARLAALKSEARRHRVYFEFKTAVINLEKARGTLLNTEVTEKLAGHRPQYMEQWEKNEK